MYLGRFYQWSGRVGDPVNSAMFVVTVGVTGIMLHVANKSILPVDHIKGSIRCEFQISGSEI